MWTRFMDMNSGGGNKEQWSYIFIEAPEKQAKIIFYNRFGHNPERVSCTCCGDDYSISESESIEQVTAYDRGCEFDSKQEKYIERSMGNTWSKYNYDHQSQNSKQYLH